MDRLPTELAIAILQEAAYSFRASDRASVVSLMQASAASYAIVAPLLYSTMVVHDQNKDILETFLSSSRDSCQTAIDSARRVCRHVTMLVVLSYDASFLLPHFLSHFTAVVHLDASIQLVQSILSLSLRSGLVHAISIWHSMFLPGVRSLGAHASKDITHIIGFAPDELASTDPAESVCEINPAEWARDVIESLPSLTHIALDVLLLDGDTAEDNLRSFDMRAFAAILGAALKYSQVRCVAFRVRGMYTLRWSEFRNVALGLRDRRVRGYCDRRTLSSWVEEENVTMEDAYAGRTFWSEARPFF